MSSALPTAGVKIVSRAFDSWTVEFQVSMVELLDEQSLLRHLRNVKQAIAQMHSLSENCLMFDGIVRKARQGDTVDVMVRVKKKSLEKGNPRITFADAAGPDETSYSHMAAFLDMMYLDSFERVITYERILQCVREARIKPELLDTDMIICTLKQVLQSQLPCRKIPIAKGFLPTNGSDAEVEFFFQAIAEPNSVDHYVSSRRVRRGDLLCRRIERRPGDRPGMNVRGDVLEPREGLDITLQAGDNAVLSLDGSEVVAEVNGVVVVTRKNRRITLLNGIKEIPDSVTVKVNPILQLDGTQVHDISTSSAVEIQGNLRMGSRILTDCEVHISGDVEEGTTVEASDDIIVDGSVSGAALCSERNVILTKGVSHSQISAREQVIVSGHIAYSTITGDTVQANSITGSNILARKMVTLESIEADEGNILSTICVGMNEFYEKRLRENQQFLEMAQANMDRIAMVVGKDIAEQVTIANTQTMVMKLLSRLHIETNHKTRKQIEVYRKLVEAIPPTRALQEQKMKENLELQERLDDHDGAAGNVIVVRERVSAKAMICVNGAQAVVEPESGEIRMSSDGKDLLLTRTVPG